MKQKNTGALHHNKRRVAKNIPLKSRTLPQYEDLNGWWEILPAVQPFTKLESEIRAKYVVVGAGFCGIAAAQRLAELDSGANVLVLEANQAGYGVSGRSAGMLLEVHSRGELKKLDVLRKQMRLWEHGLNYLRETVQDNKIDCDWSEWGRLYVSAGPDGDKQLTNLTNIYDALGKTYEHRSHDRMVHDLGTGFYERGVYMKGNALINPAALVRGIVRSMPNNVQVYENTPVLEITKANTQFHIATPEGKVIADKVILATGIHLQHIGIERGRYVSIATYASLSEPLTDEQMSVFNIGEEFGLFATSANGATVRLTRDRRLFYRNCFTHSPSGAMRQKPISGFAERHRAAVVNRWPMFANLRFPYCWGGAVAITQNDGALFGEMQPGLYAAVASDSAAMTKGACLGQLIADLAVGRQSSLLEDTMSIPRAKRLPPRPLLDLGVKWNLYQAGNRGAGEF